MNVGIFLVGSSETGPTVSDLDPLGTCVPDSLRNLRTIVDTRSANEQLLNFEGYDRDIETRLPMRTLPSPVPIGYSSGLFTVREEGPIQDCGRCFCELSFGGDP